MLTRDTAKELLYNQDSPTKVSVVLKPTAPLEPDELNLSFVLYAAECNIPVSGETFSLPPGADIEDATFDGHSKDPWGCGCSYQRWTALTRACYHGLNDFVRKLLERGADANICATGAYHVSSPLMLASGGGTTFCSNADLVEILLEYGANVNFLGSDSCGDTTALSRACCCGYKDIVLILLKNGADVNQVLHGGHGPTALAECTVVGHKDVVEILLKNGADANIETGKDLPLVKACYYGRKDIGQLLLENGAEPTPETLLQATCRGWTDLVQMMLDRGVEVHPEALDTAREKGHDDVVQVLRKHSERARDEEN
eukprot:GEMP01014803.1.p1 GENE.GEMP01014803.1~~GEMP01014803.1.p1  ORF type:complete len:314 (+),score=57.01 GEMP01014803.1:154-1095(+)